MPTLSILTPSFNYDWSVEDALESVALGGEHVPPGWKVEHVVVDDGSADGSREILQRWGSRVTLELGSGNQGQSQTLNRCLSLATGDWIGWLNADDFFLPWSLHDACRAFGSQVDVVYGDAARVDRSARFMRLMAEHPFSPWTLRWWGTYLPVGAVFLRRSLVAQLGWREDLTLLLDWDLWLRAAESGARFEYVRTPFAATRSHDAQESRQARPGRLAEKARVRREHGLPSTPRVWRAFQRVASIDHGARKAVTGAYARQLRTRPIRGRSMRWFDDLEDWSAVASLYELGYGRKVDSPFSREEQEL
jgi:glycosyltransferase involved in cell wall biosynthesis